MGGGRPRLSKVSSKGKPAKVTVLLNGKCSVLCTAYTVKRSNGSHRTNKAQKWRDEAAQLLAARFSGSVHPCGPEERPYPGGFSVGIYYRLDRKARVRKYPARPRGRLWPGFSRALLQIFFSTSVMSSRSSAAKALMCRVHATHPCHAPKLRATLKSSTSCPTPASARRSIPTPGVLGLILLSPPGIEDEVLGSTMIY